MVYFVGIASLDTPKLGFNGCYVDICWMEFWIHAMFNGIEFAVQTPPIRMGKCIYTLKRWFDGKLMSYTVTNQLVVIIYGQQENPP